MGRSAVLSSVRRLRSLMAAQQQGGEQSNEQLLTACVSSPCAQGALDESSSADEQGRGVLYGGAAATERVATTFLGVKIIAMASSEVKIDHWDGNRGPGEGHMG